MKWSLRVGVALFTLIAGVAATVERTPFHLDLNRSVPDGYATVDTVSVVRLWFSEVPAPGTTSVRLDGPGRSRVASGAPMQDPGNGRAFTVSLGRSLDPGDYTVTWRARGMDGHVAEGYFPFTVAGR